MPKLPVHKIPGTRHKIVSQLPDSLCLGIGKIVSAHAVLENRVADLLFELMQTDQATGRVALGYRAASERFKTIKQLLFMHGIKTSVPLADLLQQIQDCCNARDQVAHGVWIASDEDRIALQLTKGIYETAEGQADRKFVPEGQYVPDNYFEETRKIILTTAHAVHVLLQEVRTFFGEPVEKT